MNPFEIFHASLLKAAQLIGHRPGFQATLKESEKRVAASKQAESMDGAGI